MIRKLLAFYNPKSPIAEAYRMLRTNISFSCEEKGIKTLMLASASSTEGKTTIAVNLAIAMVNSGKKVLLVDADLRNPKIHQYFEVSNSLGMTNVILESIDYKECIIKHESIENLDILTSGPTPPNPSEILGSEKIGQFISNATQAYDLVLFDSPSVISVSDAVILSTKVDRVILVVASGVTNIKAAQKAKELLEKVNSNILGVVLNKITKKTVDDYYLYEYSYKENRTKA